MKHHGQMRARNITFIDMVDHSKPRPAISETQADQRLMQNNQNVLAMLAKADHRLLQNDYRAASAYYGAALNIMKNMQMTQSLQQDALRAQGAMQWLNDQFKKLLLEKLDKKGYSQEKRHKNFQHSLEMMLGQKQRPPVTQSYPQTPMSFYYNGTDYCEFADTSDYDWIDTISENYNAIRSEADKLLKNKDSFNPYIQSQSERPQGDVHGLLDNDEWSTLYLWENGGPNEEIAKLCPITFQTIIENVPLCRITSRAPSIMFSLLKAGAKIPPHTGMLNTRFICHLPLIVPEKCGFRVGRETRQWHEGEVMVFDDTVEHEAWNDSDEDRLVLIFDIWRPEITQEEREQIVALFEIVDST